MFVKLRSCKEVYLHDTIMVLITNFKRNLKMWGRSPTFFLLFDVLPRTVRIVSVKGSLLVCSLKRCIIGVREHESNIYYPARKHVLSSACQPIQSSLHVHSVVKFLKVPGNLLTTLAIIMVIIPMPAKIFGLSWAQLHHHWFYHL